jgi:hypothetical protein
LSSGTKAHHKRDCKHGEYSIRWQHWVDAHEWDTTHHGFSIHRRLTESHIFPSSKEKMRNQLAEDVLNWEMLHLMKVCKLANTIVRKIHSLETFIFSLILLWKHFYGI